MNALERSDPSRRVRARLAAILAAVSGLPIGLGAYTFYYARGASYFSNDPASCANCHIMQSHMDAWAQSSHRAVAVCNDCHTPHDSAVAKWAVKGINGWNHSLAFTTGHFPEPLRITAMNERVTNTACRHCHAEFVHAIDALSAGEPSLSCIRCHSDVGHAP